MSAWEFDKLIRGCRAVLPPGNFGQMYLLPVPATPTRGPTNWLIGAYKDQTKLATAIREDRALQNFLRENAVRLGLRDNDAPPEFEPRKERFGDLVQGRNTNVIFGLQRLRQDATPARPGTAPARRVSDEKQNVADFWNTQTPQSHHVVEFNHLAKIGQSTGTGTGDLDHAQLPCALLAAEFHQKYISIILKETHHWGNNRLTAELPGVYQRLYTQRSLLFWPLWNVSRLILAQAGFAVPPSV